jgi:hypothetical protein
MVRGDDCDAKSRTSDSDGDRRSADQPEHMEGCVMSCNMLYNRGGVISHLIVIEYVISAMLHYYNLHNALYDTLRASVI